MNDIIHDPNVVPLSGALWLLGLGMLRLMVYQRRKIKKMRCTCPHNTCDTHKLQ